MDIKFIDYISFPETKHLHPRLQSLTYPSLSNFQHMILHGPAGVGKYTQMLLILKRYSPSQLKCEKRVLVEKTEDVYIRISDIHYEIDMEMLGCNSKTIWNDLYNQIENIIENKYPDKQGIIVCKNFHKINRELLDIFYSYMQSDIKFILLSESISFLPINIISKCKILSIPRPSTQSYESSLNIVADKPIHSIKCALLNVDLPKYDFAIILRCITTCDFTMASLRDELYNILIFDMGVESMILAILESISFTDEQTRQVVQEIVLFLQYFNNNYRPIYHLEKFIYSIIKILSSTT